MHRYGNEAVVFYYLLIFKQLMLLCTHQLIFSSCSQLYSLASFIYEESQLAGEINELRGTRGVCNISTWQRTETNQRLPNEEKE